MTHGSLFLVFLNYSLAELSFVKPVLSSALRIWT